MAVLGLATSAGGAGVASSTDLSTSLRDAPDPVVAGRNLTYTASVTNGGPDAAVGAVLSVTRPATKGFVAVTASPPVSCTSGATSERCALGTLESGVTRDVRIVIRPRYAGRISATARVTSTTPDVTPANDAATTATVVSGPPRLSVLKSDHVPKLPRAGQKFYVNLHVRRGDTGSLLDAGSVGCEAKIAGRRISVLVHDPYPVPTCVWRVPARTKGKLMRGVISVRFRGAGARRAFAFRVV